MTSLFSLYSSNNVSLLGKDERNWGIDLLRMLSMYMVCVLHTLGAGGILHETIACPPKYCFAFFLEVSSYCAVNVFALISGYVGVKAKFKCRSLLNLWFQVMFYSIGLTLVIKGLRPDAVSRMDILYSFFPTVTGRYWYFTAYFLMFPLIPLMNYLLANADKGLLKSTLWMLFIPFSLFRCFPVLSEIRNQLSDGYSVIWLSYLYCLGGFLRLYGAEDFYGIHGCLEHGVVKKYNRFISSIACCPGKLAILYVSCSLLAFSFHTFGHIAFTKTLGFDPLCRNIVNYLNPLILLMGISLLLGFANLNVAKYSKWIRTASPLAFSVYLIHTHRQVLDICAGCLACVAALPFWAFALSVILIPAGIYIVCSLVDFVRLKLFKLIRIV